MWGWKCLLGKRGSYVLSNTPSSGMVENCLNPIFIVRFGGGAGNRMACSCVVFGSVRSGEIVVVEGGMALAAVMMMMMMMINNE